MMESTDNIERRELLADLLEDDEPLTNSSAEEFKVYKRRWFMLAVVSLLNISNAMMWLTFSAIADKTVKYYGVDVMQVNWLSLVFLIICIPLGIAAIWTLDSVGLRTGIVVASWLNAVGAALRLISAGYVAHSHRYAWLLAGQCVAAAAQPFLLFAPTKLAALWFKDDQRATANMIASIANPFGILLANVISPIVVKQPHQIPLLLALYAVPAGIAVVLATFGVCHSVPPTPPTPSAAVDSEPFWAGLKALVRVRSYWILTLCFGGGIALFTSLSTLLQQILCPHGYTDRFVGLCGALLFGVGVIGAGIASVYVDRTRRFEPVAKISFGATALCCVAFALLARHGGVGPAIAVAMSAMGLFGLALYPVCLELGVECTYPVAEATSSGFLIISGQIQGILYIFLMEYLARPAGHTAESRCDVSGDTGETPMNYTVSTLVFCGLATVLSCVFIAFFKCDYKRVAAEQRLVAERILATNAPRPAPREVLT